MEPENNHDTLAKNKQIKQEKTDDFFDDDLSDIDNEHELFYGIRIPVKSPLVMSAEENSGSRMIIKNIILNNFKSYYGEVTIGPFHESFTSIIGANGSGKSNVIDSLLFVFGYQSTKIQSEKVSLFLHKSEQHKNVGQCSVTVNFVLIYNNDSKSSRLNPGSEITITRTAFKDNTSFYTLNNKCVKFKDVATILKENGIDLVHNRFLIRQDEVEQIALMKPKAENEHSIGLLEYLEDVIGTGRYKKSINKLEQKVQVLLWEKTLKMNRLKCIKKERDELVEPAVINHLKLENESFLILNKQYQMMLYYEEKIIKTKTEELNRIIKKLCFIHNKLKAIDEQNKQTKNKLVNLSKKLALNFERYSLHQKLSEHINETDTTVRLNDNKLLEVQINNYENYINEEKEKIYKAESVTQLKEAELKQLQSQLPLLEEECVKLEENYTKVLFGGFEKSLIVKKEKDKLEPEKLRFQKLVYDKKNIFQILRTEYELLLYTEKLENQKLRRLKEQFNQKGNRVQKYSRLRKKAESFKQNTRDKLKDLETKLKNLKNDEQQMKTYLNYLQIMLTEKITAYMETTDYSLPIKRILNLKNNGMVEGILGRCGDCGQVENKYDIPASTACESTDQIVVETIDVAYKCIQLLKANNIGKVTFSILSHIQELKPLADANHVYPENAKRVFDLIKIQDQRFRLTFYSGLHDTLLAEDLEQARRIAFGTQTQYTVVTYKGYMINKSGIMSGGGETIKKKIRPPGTTSRDINLDILSQRSQKDEVETLDKFYQDYKVKLRNAQIDITDFQIQIERKHRIIEEINIVVKRYSSQINNWKEVKCQIKELIKDQQLTIVNNKTDPNAVFNKKAEMRYAEKEIEKAQMKYDKFNYKMDGLKQKIEEITEEEPKEAKRLLDEATKKLDETHYGINQVNVDIKAAERQIKKSETEIENLTGYINECKEKQETNNTRITLNGEIIKDQLLLLNEISKSIAEQKKCITNLTNEEDENIKRNYELRKNEIRLKLEYDDVEKIVAYHVKQCEKYKLELSQLKLHAIPNIDNIQHDSVVKSNQNHESKCQKQNESILNEENKNEHTEKNYETSGEHELIQMQVDDDADVMHYIDIKEFPQYTDEQLESFDLEIIKHLFYIIQEVITENKPCFSVLEDYKKKNQEYSAIANEVTEISKLYDDHIGMVYKMRQRRKDEFMVSFKRISISLKETYQMITFGGDAELELCDSLDPFSKGVNFRIKPPQKTWTVISNLSSKEKSLPSLAFRFALHHYKPSPLYIMDEIDAALDFKNVSLVAYYMKERIRYSQFIVISSRSNMYEKANRLVGIYKTNDCSKTVSLSKNVHSLSETARALDKLTLKD